MSRNGSGRALDGLWAVCEGDALSWYGRWPDPAAIISDGAYGIAGFPGDPPDPAGLAGWYAPHIAAWSQRAASLPAVTLWFWNTEVGWATVHPLLEAAGWEYVQAISWDKGVSHAAGNTNSQTLRRFPTVTELCALYRRPLTVPAGGGPVPGAEWLRSEWKRAGRTMGEANRACGTAAAASRKYLASDEAWYPPPAAMFDVLAAWANEHGPRRGRPYFSLDGDRPATGGEWEGLRHRWNHQHGLTNVWAVPALHGSERAKTAGGATAHPAQKPVELMRRIVAACTAPGDTVWEPFGGLSPAVCAAVSMGRRGFSAETDPAWARRAQWAAANSAARLPI